MANESIQQEILFVSSSGFAQRPCAERDSSENAKSLSQQDKFKEACWNGLLKEMLPEVFAINNSSEKIFLWQMRECKHVLALEMASGPCDIVLEASIDPYCFSDSLIMS
ncbi:MAG: hypothetical protein EOO10_25720 [Chitinophagaceae bacterium]|nr:MAG: hypothetical protein EOO10_25720 [Chitinophagaceae bacterium]